MAKNLTTGESATLTAVKQADGTTLVTAGCQSYILTAEDVAKLVAARDKARAPKWEYAIDGGCWNLHGTEPLSVIQNMSKKQALAAFPQLVFGYGYVDDLEAGKALVLVTYGDGSVGVVTTGKTAQVRKAAA